MMRLLQASDFHLRPDRPERLAALREVVARATESRAHALLIPGDLFDDPAAAAALRNEVRRLLEEFPGTVLLLPGNHDPAWSEGASAFPAGADWGRRTAALTAGPWCEHFLRVEGEEPVRVIGAPYRPESTLGRDLAGLESDPSRTVLLAHGTLRTSWLDRLAEGGESGYYPIREDDLRGRFAYAALGHLHDRSTFEGWTADSAWGYSGSPVAITRGETGRRHAVLVDFRAGEGVENVERLALATDYWAKPIEGRLVPWSSPTEVVHDLIERMTKASESVDRRRGLLVRLNGWIDGDETWARSTLEAELPGLEDRNRTVELLVDVRTIADLLERHEWLPDLNGRMRRIAAERDEREDVLSRAVGYLVEAVRESES